jgi:hypothetical protein
MGQRRLAQRFCGSPRQGDRVNHEELADLLDVSVASIRQARLAPTAKAHRNPPDKWEGAVIRLAERRVFHYRKLIDQIRGRQ